MRINKPKDMMRSILPSKARKWAKHKKRQVNRNQRHHVNIAISQYDWEGDDDSNLICEMKTAEGDYKRDIKFAVTERRGGDKISHFVRWAKKKTEKIEDVRDKYYSFVSQIGGSGDVIRRHAIGHFIEPRYDFRHAGLGEVPYSFRKDEVFEPIIKAELIEYLESAIKNGKQDVLNEILGRVTPHQCNQNQKCWEEETRSYRRMEWQLLPDGTRRKIYAWIDLEGGQSRLSYMDRNGVAMSAFTGSIGYNTSSKHLVHKGPCKNTIKFDGLGSARRVVRILHRRKMSRTLRAFWEMFQSE